MLYGYGNNFRPSAERGGKSNNLPKQQQELCNWINSTNEEVTKSDILDKSDEIGIPERTTNAILKGFVEKNLIVKVSRGVYAAKR